MTLKVFLENIPEQLCELKNWVCWKYGVRDGKPTKIPINPRTGGKAQTDNPGTWSSLREACKIYHLQKPDELTNLLSPVELAAIPNLIAGIGLVVTGTEIVGIDLDDAILENGELRPWAQEIVDKVKSYTETSPSGTGIRIFAFGSLPPKGRKKAIPTGNPDDKCAIEMYDKSSPKYLTVTGHRFGEIKTIENRSTEITELHHQYWKFDVKESVAKDESKELVVVIPDEELLERIKDSRDEIKFRLLWEGNYDKVIEDGKQKYPSQSEADLALCYFLSFWTGRNAEQMDRMFRSSKLMRDKWDELRGPNTYGEITIQHAIDNTTTVYQPKPKTEVHGGVKRTENFPRECIQGIAKEFADLYSKYSESPWGFFAMDFLIFLGAQLSPHVELNTSLYSQPRLYGINIGNSADAKKSWAINQTERHFSEVRLSIYSTPNACIPDNLNVMSLASAEGLGVLCTMESQRDKQPIKVLNKYDELKTLTVKAGGDNSNLAGALATLYESNDYSNATKKDPILINQLHLSMITASTSEIFESAWKGSALDLGLLNRFFLIKDSSSKSFSMPPLIPEHLKKVIVEKTKEVIIRYYSAGLTRLNLTPEALEYWDNWYKDWFKKHQGSEYARRLDGLGLRLMVLLALSENKTVVNANLVYRVTQILEWQYLVRMELAPDLSPNLVAKAENIIRKYMLRKGKTIKKWKLRMNTNYTRFGEWNWNVACENLIKSGELEYDEKNQELLMPKYIADRLLNYQVDKEISEDVETEI